MPVEGYGLKFWWNLVIIVWTARTQGKGHIRKEEGIQLCSLSSQVFMYYVCPDSQSGRLLKHPSLPQRQQVGWVDNVVIFAAGIHLICLSGLRSSHDMFPPCLLFREKVVSDQYLGKCNITFTVLFMIGWNFTRCCKSSGMCLPWHALLLPSTELHASLQVSIQAGLVHWIIYYPWEGELAGCCCSGLWCWAVLILHRWRGRWVSDNFTAHHLRNWQLINRYF